MTTLEIFADYHQIYLCDPAHGPEDWSVLWDDRTLDDRICGLAHTLVFCTGRNMIVPVDVVEHKQQPNLEQLAASADHAVVGGLKCSSGRLKLVGCTGYLPDAFTLTMPVGPVGVAFLSHGLGTIDPNDGLDGGDRYALHVWPAATVPAVAVLKRWPQ